MFELNHKRFKFSPSLLNAFDYYRTEKMFGERIAETEQSILDKLNRIPFPQSEAMLKGIAFEDELRYGEPQVGFTFDEKLIQRGREELLGGFWQTWLHTEIKVGRYDVVLHGYSDVICRHKNVDVKTTSYVSSLPMYLNSYQHKVYLLAANDMGIKLNEHRYMITDFKEWFYEDYGFHRERYTEDLQEVCGELINFVETNLDSITNVRIFDREPETA